MEKIMTKKSVRGISIDLLYHPQLKSDLSNKNILSDEGDTYLVSTGKIHEEPETWAIDIENGEVYSYLYESEFEYKKDLQTLNLNS